MLNYKFRLYPTHEQELALEQTLDGCRWVYNYFMHIAPMSISDMQFALTELKEQHPWLRNYHSKMLQMVVHDIGAARNALKELRKRGHKTGRLSYKVTTISTLLPTTNPALDSKIIDCHFQR